MKLFICLRVYPKISKTIKLPFPSKLILFVNTMKSLERALDNVDYRIHIIFDECPNEYIDRAKDIFDKKLLITINLTRKGNTETFLQQIDICMTQTFSEYLFLLEDDYLFNNSKIINIVEFMESNHDVHFISPFNHSDYSILEIHKIKREVFQHNSIEYIRRVSTTLTFFTRKNTLRQTSKVFASFKLGNDDVSIWLCLTKEHIFNIISLVKFFIHRNKTSCYRHYVYIIKVYLYLFPFLFNTKKYTLVSPNPGFATHLDSIGYDYTINWNPFIKIK